MMVEHHPLLNEFPEHRQQLHALRMSSSHFARLCDLYEEADKAIVRIENEIDKVGEAQLDLLKKRRLALKDELYELIRQSPV